jgi:hypothetical protein
MYKLAKRYTMIYSLVEAQVREAADRAENRNADGTINWNFVDSDCYMAGLSKWFANDEQYYETWEEIVENFIAEMREEAASEIQLEMEV